MFNLIPSAESGKINVAPNALELSRERFFEVLRGVDAVMQATKDLPAITPPKDVVALSMAEQRVQPAVDNTFQQMTNNVDKQYVDEQFEQMTAALEREHVNNVFEEIASNTQSSIPYVPAPTDHISLKGDEHPNQAAIDQALLLAMEAHAQQERQDVGV
jgi:hypothetical protein